MTDEITFESSNLENIEAGQLKAKLSADGTRVLRYYIDFRQTALDLHKELTAPDVWILQNKVNTLMAQWDKRYDAYRAKREVAKGKELAGDLTIQAELQRDALRNTLNRTLTIDDTVDWMVLKDNSEYQAKPFPEDFREIPVERPKPDFPKIGILQKILGRTARLKAEYELSLETYRLEAKTVSQKNSVRRRDFEIKRDAWNREQITKKRAFERRQTEENTKVDYLERAWLEGQTEAVEEHASIVLEASQHEEVVPKEWELQYQPAAKLMLVRYRLPSPDTLPTVKTVRFVAATGELKETSISDKDLKALFDDLCYQVCLRTLHELFEADIPHNISKIVFNGWTDSIDKATGKRAVSTLLSVMTTREDFLNINLAQIDPKTCFKALKGISASTLIGLTPIAPVMELIKTDRRFVGTQAVELEDDGTTNLAAMNWEEFEHLVRDVFEREFAARGGEVKITQSSNDGGVDAVAFDPDPISGGKIIIQAKRYTRTVGLSAVRDLYGTTMNEGASRGILVTTADYGPAAYKFAADKPLTLMTGAHLLHLLEKHGTKAKIDIRGARQQMGLKEKR